MISYLRKLFRREPPPRPDTEEVAKIRAILAARKADVLSCCGATRYSHGQFRSGALRCPPSRKELDAEFKS